MSEILSQSQIDDLLSELFAGKTPETEPEESASEKKVKNYDFKCPKKFSKDQLKFLRNIYDIFARHMASYLSGILRTSCQIRIDAIEEQPYYEYNNALPDTVMMGIYDLKPLDGSLMVDFSNAVTFSIIERLLGGEGNGTYSEREFTDIEIALMDKILKQVQTITKFAWNNYLELEPELRKIETNARLLQSVSMDEIVVIIVMEISIRSIKGTISICIPSINLEPLLDNASKNVYSNKRKVDTNKDKEYREAILAKIKDTKVDMTCVFGDAVLSFKDVMNLQVGDVLMLDQTVDSSVKIRIGNNTWFKGTPGIIKNKKQIKITDVI